MKRYFLLILSILLISASASGHGGHGLVAFGGGRVLVATQAVTSGTLHIATKDGEAMFFHDSVDFSTYAGTDAGSTPYYFVFTDSSGKTSSAYGGAVGGGEALGPELIVAFDFTSGWTEFLGGSIIDADSFNSGPSGMGIYKAITISGKIIYIAWAGTGVGAVAVDASDPGMPVSINASGYRCPFHSSVLLKANVNQIVDVTSLSCKALTDVPGTGLHLISTKNGIIRNMERVTSGFNRSGITSVKIYQ